METSLGVQVTVTGVAQVKVMKEDKVLKIASEQFLGMTPDEIKGTILMTLEGHLRAILGKLRFGTLLELDVEIYATPIV